MTIDSRAVSKQLIAQSFRGILRISPNEGVDEGLTDNPIEITDSLGNATTIKVSNNNTEISNLTSNNTILTGNTIINGDGNTIINNNLSVNNINIKNTLTLIKGNNETIISNNYPNQGDFLFVDEAGKYAPSNFKDKVNEVIDNRNIRQVKVKYLYKVPSDDNYKWIAVDALDAQPNLLTTTFRYVQFPLDEMIVLTPFFNDTETPVILSTKLEYAVDSESHNTDLTQTNKENYIPDELKYDLQKIYWCESNTPVIDNYYGSGSRRWSSGSEAFIITNVYNSTISINLKSGDMNQWGHASIYGVHGSDGGSVAPFGVYALNKKGIARIKLIYITNLAQ